MCACILNTPAAQVNEVRLRTERARARRVHWEIRVFPTYFLPCRAVTFGLSDKARSLSPENEGVHAIYLALHKGEEIFLG